MKIRKIIGIIILVLLGIVFLGTYVYTFGLHTFLIMFGIMTVVIGLVVLSIKLIYGDEK